MDIVAIVRASFAAYQQQDRDAAAALLAPGFRFTSPQDDHLDREEWLRTCFPTAARFSRQELLRVQALDDETVFVLYEYDLAPGETYRNAEVHTVRDGVVTEVQVFFGGTY